MGQEYEFLNSISTLKISQEIQKAVILLNLAKTQIQHKINVTSYLKLSLEMS